MPTMKIDRVKILTKAEIGAVLADLRRKRRSTSTRLNHVVFRLSCCLGCRVSEIRGLSMANVKLEGNRPHVYIPGSIAKRGKARRIPCWWDQGTLATLRAWKAERAAQGATSSDPFIASPSKHRRGQRLSVRTLQARWRTAIKCLGPERVSVLSIHSGRHSFVSHSLNGGRSLAEARDAAGHASASVTSLYLHSVPDDDNTVGNLFDFG
ncbi:MAG: site-specific integrase [Pirellulales bacterium]|nr:site-specific integrase [Pirellulales bacterium]